MFLKKKKSIIFCVFLVVFCSKDGFSQEGDSLLLNTEVGLIIQSNDFLPFYLNFNRGGIVQEDQSLFLAGEVKFRKEFGKGWYFKSEGSFRNDLLGEAYGQFGFRPISIWGGLRKLTLGGIENNTLTTGSLGMGNNARPIPQVGTELTDYLDFPLSHGYFKFKGGISHGWLGDDRHVKGAFLHQKYVKVKVDLEKLIGLNIYSSIIHFAQFGGDSPDGGELPSSFDDFLSVFFGRGIPDLDGMFVGEVNALGNHLGVTEWTIEKKLGEHWLKLNYQKPFEDGGSMQYVSFKDFLVGAELSFPDESLFEKIYFEYVRTMSQGGKGLPDPTQTITNEAENFGYEFGGRDDYYNNYIYQTGWTNKGYTISNPLFFTYHWTQGFLPEYPNYANAVVNNRIKAVSAGAILNPISNLNIRVLVTLSKNYGTYAGLYEGRFAWNGIKTNPEFDYVFLNGKNQFYSLLDVNYQTRLFNQPVNLKGMFAVDSGELYDNAGVEFSIEFMLK